MPRATTDEKLRLLLSDLGRATLRGVRKCPKCGTYNGTRGLSCKNKSCDVVFKEAGEKRKMSMEACKLFTGTGTKVFSVRVRDKGPDYRGFVQLPMQQTWEQTLDGEAPLDQTSALCFVDTCQRSFDTSILKCHEKSEPVTTLTCQHIQAALRCYTKAQPVQLKNSIINILNMNSEMKQELWQLVSETNGPVVQRVSKNIMAVKCKASPKHPLGYLHFSFFVTKLKDRVENKYFCSCTAFKGQVKHASNREDGNFKKCVHFYACIAAFAGDPKLSEEFSFYLSLERRDIIPMLSLAGGDGQGQLVTILRASGEDPCDVEVEVLGGVVSLRDDASLLDESGIAVSDDGSLPQIHGLEILPDALEVQIHSMESETLDFSDVAEEYILQNEMQPSQAPSVKRKIAEPPCSPVQGKKVHNINILRRQGSKKTASNSIVNKHDPVDESSVEISFLQWLASVTERINQSMHFQFDGKPEPLVYFVPQVFFDCLRERISSGGKKKRLPNFISGCVRKNAVPLGTFTTYTWHITNIIHLKQIFETPLVPLEITRSFVENHDGTFAPYNRQKDENEIFRKVNNQPLIKPLELKTFLKVGNTAPDQVEPTPFIIEWTPDILPQSKVGELRLSFEFGHQRNGLVEKLQVSPRACKKNSEILVSRLQTPVKKEYLYTFAS
ncbi:uncharacterized protein C2orf42 [Bacillus rossius redtenbacheri]|uniref:uncharacterized protein C2orf42 n=1 Tax=Bacillus rossius redtenbacheri TaxID=93214 RepID=UPI002FDD368B